MMKTMTVEHHAVAQTFTTRERELSAIISAYNQVTERLKESHDSLRGEIRRLTEELSRKNRELARRERLAALGEMAAGLAHEIRNPLGGIQLYASMLERDLRDSAEQVGLVRKIRSGVQILESLVSDVLAFAGEVEPIVEPVPVSALLIEAKELASAQAAHHEVVLEIDPGEPHTALRCDRRQLLRVLLNLLLNAIESVGPGGWARLSSMPVPGDNQMHRLIVSDNGPGIAPDCLERVFNPFFTTKDSGTGLGLAIVHQICEAHGGTVRARNRAEGGAEFALTLPVACTPVDERDIQSVGETC